MKLELPETFEDVAVKFSKEEWKMLSKKERDLHMEVMAQNYENMVSVGYNIPKEQLLLLIERHEVIRCGTEERRLVQEKRFPDGTAEICRNVDFSEIQSQHSSHGKYLHSEYDKGLSCNLSVTGQNDLVQTGKKLHNHVKSNGFVRKMELEGDLETNRRGKPCDSLEERGTLTQSTELFNHSRKRQKISKGHHKKVIHREKQYKGTISSKCLPGKKGLAEHQRIQDRGGKRKSVLCTACGKSFRDKSILLAHQVVHTGQKPYKCDICDKSFKFKRSMATHQYIHTEHKPYKCPFCDKSFAQKSNMLRHQHVHTGQKPYKCTMCDKSFVQKFNLIRHNLSHVGLQPYKCAKCDKAFPYERSLVRHQISHTAQTPYKCSVCDKSFRWKCSMLRHQSNHTEPKLYTCTVCDKGYTDKRLFEAHQNIHAEQKPYQCATCNKGFVQKANLLCHQYIHSEDKPYKCPVCDKGFAQKHNLILHQYTHSGQKPYNCTLCDKSFMKKYSMVKHQLVHSQQTP